MPLSRALPTNVAIVLVLLFASAAGVHAQTLERREIPVHGENWRAAVLASLGGVSIYQMSRLNTTDGTVTYLMRVTGTTPTRSLLAGHSVERLPGVGRFAGVPLSIDCSGEAIATERNRTTRRLLREAREQFRSSYPDEQMREPYAIQQALSDWCMDERLELWHVRVAADVAVVTKISACQFELRGDEIRLELTHCGSLSTASWWASTENIRLHSSDLEPMHGDYDSYHEAGVEYGYTSSVWRRSHGRFDNSLSGFRDASTDDDRRPVLRPEWREGVARIPTQAVFQIPRITAEELAFARVCSAPLPARADFRTMTSGDSQRASDNRATAQAEVAPRAVWVDDDLWLFDVGRRSVETYRNDAERGFPHWVPYQPRAHSTGAAESLVIRCSDDDCRDGFHLAVGDYATTLVPLTELNDAEPPLPDSRPVFDARCSSTGSMPQDVFEHLAASP